MTFYSNVKQKSYTLNPRGKPLYEDANRFGTKMLEKMGWSKGKGLGMKEDGEQNFIRVSHKTDQRGMGYQDRDDQWTGHENEFNSLLKSLDNSANVSENESANEDANDGRPAFGLGFGAAEKKNKKTKSVKMGLSGKSLEKMSKKSGVRVHYKKFTRGKDISKYSEKDLANIFGKKCVNENNIEAENAQTELALESPEIFHGITTIETGTTIQDYFKKKKNEPVKRSKDKTNEDEQTSVDQPEKKRRKKDKESKKEKIVPQNVDITNEVESSQFKMEKKKKKSKKGGAIEEEIVISDENSDCEIVSIKMKKKKKKSKKTSDESQVECISSIVGEIEEEEAIVNDSLIDSVDKVSKKKKRNKNNSSSATTSNPEVNRNQSVPITNTEFIDGILNILVNNNNSGYSSTALNQANAGADNNGDADEMTLVNRTNQNIAMNEVFEINRYHAEMFRFIDLDGFPSANLSDLSGYGYNKEFELKISEKSKDQNKINDLWDYALINKYGKEVIQTKKAKRYSIKHLKKKNVFMKL